MHASYKQGSLADGLNLWGFNLIFYGGSNIMRVYEGKHDSLVYG